MLLHALLNCLLRVFFVFRVIIPWSPAKFIDWRSICYSSVLRNVFYFRIRDLKIGLQLLFYVLVSCQSNVNFCILIKTKCSPWVELSSYNLLHHVDFSVRVRWFITEKHLLLRKSPVRWYEFAQLFKCGYRSTVKCDKLIFVNYIHLYQRLVFTTVSERSTSLRHFTYNLKIWLSDL